MTGRKVVVRFTAAEADHLIHLILEDGKESAYGNVERYLARAERLRERLMRARRTMTGGKP